MALTRTLAICMFWAGAWSIPAPGQDTSGQFRPEMGFYVQQGAQLRLEFVDAATGTLSTHQWLGDFSVFVRAALKPVFRRNLRDRDDVFLNKYLTFAAGYRYRTGLTNGDSTSENRGIVELTPQYFLPWQLTVSDRNRGEFRFIKGQGFSTRYRNRLRMERDFKHGWLSFTPYAYYEIFYDLRYGQVTLNRFAFGSEFPIGPHLVLDPYYLRSNGSHSTPRHINELGFKVNFFF